jgi:Pyruvate/2-oxoacid:ferredoxin oxidoreductase delta subunit
VNLLVVRKVIRIDEEKCNGCGQCVTACAEGALAIVDGKAKVVKDSFCDGLGACIGECPEGALEIVEREVEEFDEEAVKHHLHSLGREHTHPALHEEHHHHEHEGMSCPSAKPMILEHKVHREKSAHAAESRLEHWPIQLMLVPETAPFLKGRDLYVIADCAAMAYPDLHAKFLEGNAVVMGCPKFDDQEIYSKKLKGMIEKAGIKSISVVNMEVPCCFGLQRLVAEAVQATGDKIPFRQYVIGINGEMQKEC